MLRSLLLGFVFCLSIYSINAESNDRQSERESRIVKTAQGPVRGYKNPDEDIYIFYSIPYASAPTGPNKYKAPLPPPTWSDPLEAVDKGIICPQGEVPNLDLNNKFMQEDCLIASVYVPDTDETNLPIVVYVHGGAYLMGYGDLTAPTKLLQSKKLIAVTFNYRLGVHGFLCLGTEDVPGNAGMKDQVALLRWVKKNIANFGGNPDDVTIAGYSAGSSAVDLLMLSESTKRLYNKVIPECGANVGVWSVQLDPLELAKSHAKQLNFNDVEDVYALESFSKTASLNLLNSGMSINHTDSTFSFTPCVERDNTKDAFLIDNPVNILKQGNYNKVPVLYGFANMEGLMLISEFANWSDRMNENFSEFLPADLHFETEEKKIEIAISIKEFYFEDKPVGESTIENYTNYFSDVMFAYPTLRSTKLQVEAGSNSIYLYEYSLAVDEINENLPDIAKNNLRGANHCAHTAAIFDAHHTSVKSRLPEYYKKMQELLQVLWINFITTGAPVPEGSSLSIPAWSPVNNADRSPHMSFGETIELRGPLLEERARFWDNIYDKYYRAPVPPPPPPITYTF